MKSLLSVLLAIAFLGCAKHDELPQGRSRSPNYPLKVGASWVLRDDGYRLTRHIDTMAQVGSAKLRPHRRILDEG